MNMISTTLASAATVVLHTAAPALAKGALVMLAAIATVPLLRRSSAAQRYALIVAGFGIQLLLFAASPLPSSLRVGIVPRFDGSSLVPGRLAGTSGVASDDAPAGTIPTDGTLRQATPMGGRAAPILAVLWLAGALILLLRRCAAMVFLGRLRRRGRPASPPLQQAAQELGVQLGVTGPVDLLLGADRSPPMAFGIRRATVQLPQTAVAWQPERLRIVLLHELAHVRRRDALTKLVADVALALSWINPLAWVLHRGAERERERACDDAVLCAGTRPSAYVAEIVEIARLGYGSRVPMSAATAFARRSEFRGRMEAVLATSNARRPLSRRALSALAASTATLALALTLIGQRPQAVYAFANQTAVSMTGCRWDGGRHINRTSHDHIGRSVWQVEWTGVGCDVAFRTVGDIARRPSLGALLAARVQDSATLTIRDPAGSRTIQLTAAIGRDSLGAFGLELDRHTAFAIDERFPLVAAGGIDSTFAEIERMQGDHAAGEYLYRMVERRLPRDGHQLERVFALADTRVFNDYELNRLLRAVASTYDLSALGLAARYTVSANRISNPSVRDAVLRPAVEH